jgi:hypothetical protein
LAAAAGGIYHTAPAGGRGSLIIEALVYLRGALISSLPPPRQLVLGRHADLGPRSTASRRGRAPGQRGGWHTVTVQSAAYGCAACSGSAPLLLWRLPCGWSVEMCWVCQRMRSWPCWLGSVLPRTHESYGRLLVVSCNRALFAALATAAGAAAGLPSGRCTHWPGYLGTGHDVAFAWMGQLVISAASNTCARSRWLAGRAMMTLSGGDWGYVFALIAVAALLALAVLLALYATRHGYGRSTGLGSPTRSGSKAAALIELIDGPGLRYLVKEHLHKDVLMVRPASRTHTWRR